MVSKDKALDWEACTRLVCFFLVFPDGYSFELADLVDLPMLVVKQVFTDRAKPLDAVRGVAFDLF